MAEVLANVVLSRQVWPPLRSGLRPECQAEEGRRAAGDAQPVHVALEHPRINLSQWDVFLCGVVGRVAGEHCLYRQHARLLVVFVQREVHGSGPRDADLARRQLAACEHVIQGDDGRSAERGTAQTIESLVQHGEADLVPRMLAGERLLSAGVVPLEEPSGPRVRARPGHLPLGDARPLPPKHRVGRHGGEALDRCEVAEELGLHDSDHHPERMTVGAASAPARLVPDAGLVGLLRLLRRHATPGTC
mmetsp:Transcript_373/g.1247  ORF Transcript_373/g.1247 Transcript_373/m.1247 type:complete len:247 (-) Transcript_373:80-820(-)